MQEIIHSGSHFISLLTGVLFKITRLVNDTFSRRIILLRLFLYNRKLRFLLYTLRGMRTRAIRRMLFYIFDKRLRVVRDSHEGHEDTHPTRQKLVSVYSRVL